MSPVLSPALSRREVLRRLMFTAAAAGTPPWLAACLGSESMTPLKRAGSRFADIGPLQPADANGLMLPAGFSSRVLAVSDTPVLPDGYVWHTLPDGGATFAMPDGGWVYVSNSEIPDTMGLPVSGGAGALRFDAQGEVTGAYSILSGTRSNCAGGKTPWQTWLSCEETADGLVFECDPTGAAAAVALPVLGLFAHEAVAVDPFQRVLYLTEDLGDGRFYRFIPAESDWPEGAARPALQAGKLQVLRYLESPPDAAPEGFRLDVPQPVVWDDVIAPEAPQAATREAERAAGRAAPGTPFRGGEGIWYRDGIVFFSTKSDNRIWALDVVAQTLEVIYDFAAAKPENAILSGVDNLTVSEYGDVLVSEDGGDMDLCVILPDRKLVRLLKATDLQAGTEAASELTGPAFSPDGTRLYFSAQRNGRNGAIGPGITFEVTLPFSACPTGSC